LLAWDDACTAVTGHALDVHALKTDGLTDHQVAARILEQVGHRVTEEDLGRMVEVYERRLPDRLPMRHGRVLDGVREILAYLRARRPDVHSMLLTGNTKAGARAKLAHYELSEFFEGGAFSTDSGPRSHIAARALEEIRARFPDVLINPRDVFVIGDTPHDIDCARAIGARTIAVASGVHAADDLRAHGAWRVLDRIPDPAAFEALIAAATVP
jgi:phosphoglycolate phosphatase-like HAD superfamily hydrolase